MFLIEARNKSIWFYPTYEITGFVFKDSKPNRAL